MSDSLKDKEITTDAEPEYKPSVINTQAINSALRTAQISIFVGFLLDGICGLYLYNLLKQHNAGTIQVVLFGAVIIFGAGLLIKGIARILSVKTIGKYVSILHADERMDIAQLAKKININEQKVLKELEHILRRNYLNGSLDTQANSITLVKK